MNTDYASAYRELYERHWWWRARERAILNELRGVASLAHGRRTILDVGCGDGLLFDALQPFGDVYGVEPDPATTTPNGKWSTHIHHQPFDERFQPGMTFDLILMLDVLEHLPHPDEALRHARSLLRPGGSLLVTVPALPSLWTNHDVLNHHFCRYTKRTLRDLFRDSSWSVHRLRYLFHWTCPIKLMVRWTERIAPRPPATPSVPNRLVNSLCYAACRFEQATISRFGMPFGSSLLAVAS